MTRRTTRRGAGRRSAGAGRRAQVSGARLLKDIGPDVTAGRLRYEPVDVSMAPQRPVLGHVVSYDDTTKGLATIKFEGAVANIEVQCHVMDLVTVRNGDPVVVVFYSEQPTSGVVIGTLERGPSRLALLQPNVGLRRLYSIDAIITDGVAISRDGVAQLTIDGPTGKVDIISGKLNLSGIPTSSAGLVAGDVWKNGTVLNIV